MLERLHTVDWNALTHAYGPAGDVPGLIQGLTAADRQARKDAYWELYGNIFHQGTRYPATAPAVPFLLELLADPGTPDRHELLLLLTHLVCGSSASPPIRRSTPASPMARATTLTTTARSCATSTAPPRPGSRSTSRSRPAPTRPTCEPRRCSCSRACGPAPPWSCRCSAPVSPTRRAP